MLNWSVHGLMLELVKQDDDLMDNAQKAHRKAETQNQYLTSLDPVVEGFGTMFPIAQSAMKTEIERAREDDDMCRGMSRSLRRGDSPDPASCRCLFWGQYHPPCRHISCDWLCGNPITSAQVAGYVERFIGIDAEVILPAWSVLGTSLTPEDEDDVLDPLSGRRGRDSDRIPPHSGSATPHSQHRYFLRMLKNSTSEKRRQSDWDTNKEALFESGR